jgi:hypothetical protein
MTPIRHQIGLGLLMAAAMVPVFMLYQHPDFLWMLASQAWSCF